MFESILSRYLLVNFFKIIAFILVLFSLSSLQGCSESTKTYELRGKTMGTHYQISLAISPPQTLTASHQQDLQQAIEQALASINQAMSTYQADSAISQFNRYQGTEWFPVSENLASVTQNALTISQQSHGTFDPTVYPLVKLWGFGEQFAQQIPDQQALQTAKAKVGYENLQVRLQPPALKKNQGDLMLDLSAIAKGYAVDQISALLMQQGWQNHLVDIGGEVKAHGLNAKGIAWRIGIEQPDTTPQHVMQGVQLHNTSIATSGNYRNYFEVDGKRYSHTIDPTTGKPVTHTLASATVIHPQNEWADAYATTLMVLGLEKGLAFAEQYQLPVYLLAYKDKQLTAHYSSAFKPYLKSQR
jgi:thiamine biosynthesis lipoprotein